MQLLEKLHFVADLRSTGAIDWRLHQLRPKTRTSRPSATPAEGSRSRQRRGAPDYPAASGFFATLVGCDLFPDPNYGAFCDRDIDTMIEHAAQIPTEDPAASGRAWAKVDHAITDQAPFVSLVNPIDVDFVSERLENYQYNPEWGLLLAQVWVR